ncbi:MAG: hypothetical protein AB1742_04240 [bacterium]
MMHDGISPLLEFASEKLHVLLLVMAAIYAFKISWVLRHPAGRERQAGSGSPHTNATKGAAMSLFSIAMPWTMESARKHPFLYVQFVVFHVCVATSIAMTIVFSYLPWLIASKPAVFALQAVYAAGFIVGCMRLLRRAADRYVRAVSTPDDYFSLGLLVVWIALSFLVAAQAPAFAAAKGQWDPGAAAAPLSEAPVLAYYFITSFFLLYVPFSKISHYIYYPFTRWYLGKTLGHRGVYPVRRYPVRTGGAGA